MKSIYNTTQRLFLQRGSSVTTSSGFVTSSGYSMTSGNSDKLDGYDSTFFSSTGHNHNLSDLSDVDSSAKANGRILIWNTSTGKHLYASLGAGSGDMTKLVYDTNDDGIVNASDYSTSSGYAVSSGFALSSITSATADFATSSGYSNNSNTSNYSTSSGYSTTSGYSTSSGNADTLDGHHESYFLNTSSGDFNSFTEKLNINEEDIVLLEDSIDSFSKKKITLENLVAYSHRNAGPVTSTILTDNGDGTATVNSFDAYVYSTTDFSGLLHKYTIASGTFTLTDGIEQYIVVDYNSGIPIIRLENDKTLINGSNIFTIFVCWRQGNTIHSVDQGEFGLGLVSKTNRSLYNTEPYRRSIDGGLILSVTSTPSPRTVLVSGGLVYVGATSIVVQDFNSSTDQLTRVTYTSTGWVYEDRLVYGNTNYQGSTGTIELTEHRYANRFFYRSIGDVKQVFYTLGRTQFYNEDESFNELPPTTPILLRDHCVYIGRVCVEKLSSSGVVHPEFDHIDELPESIYYDNAGGLIKPTISTSTGIIIVSQGDYLIYSTSDYLTATLNRYTISGNTFIVPDDGISHYVVANYNSGNPIIELIDTVAPINQSDIIPIATVYNLSGVILYLDWDEMANGLANKLCHRLVKTERFSPEQGGLKLGEAATRYVTITSGNVWYGACYTSLVPINSSTPGQEIALWYHVGGVWTRTTTTQYDNTYYDNGLNRVALNPNRYAVNWVYRGVSQQNNRPVIVLGQGNYVLAEAINSKPPAQLPSLTASFGILIGRIIVKKGDSTATQIDSITESISLSSTYIHNGLSGLQGGTTDEYYHLTSAGYTIATQPASTTQAGYLTSAGYITFNNKQEALTNPITGTGSTGQFAQFTGTTTITGISQNTAFNQNFETSSGNIKMNGVSSTGSLDTIARADHVHPRDTAIVTNHSLLTGLTSDDHTQYLLANGTRPLSANWDAGSFQIRAETFRSDVSPGTSPFTVASNTVVTLLNADYWDGYHYSDIIPIQETHLFLNDVTTWNATSTGHGFLPRLSANSSQFLDGTGNWATPTGASENDYSLTTFTTQTSVTVTHNFGSYPIVQVITSTGVVFIPYTITHSTVNAFTVTFSASQSGSIIASLGSPQPQALKTISTDYNINITDRILLVTAAGKTLTLPTAIGNTGREFIIDNNSPGDIYVICTGAETIEDETSQTIPSNSAMNIYSTGSKYRIY
jgi:hypothetical protein